MRALATVRSAVFLTRREGGAFAVAVRFVAGCPEAVGRRALAADEVEPFLDHLRAAGVEVVEAVAPAAVALPAPAAAAELPEAPRRQRAPKAVPSPFAIDVFLSTHQVRGPNVS